MSDQMKPSTSLVFMSCTSWRTTCQRETTKNGAPHNAYLRADGDLDAAVLGRAQRERQVRHAVRRALGVRGDAADLLLGQPANQVAQHHAGLQVHQQVRDGCLVVALQSDSR